MLAVIDREQEGERAEQAVKDSAGFQMDGECERSLFDLQQRAPRTSAFQVPKQLAVGGRLHRANTDKAGGERRVG